MTPEELAGILSEMYRNAPADEAMTMIHLFGVRYADAIHDCGATVPAIVRMSELPNNLHTELYKGIRLARYVVARWMP